MHDPNSHLTVLKLLTSLEDTIHYMKIFDDPNTGAIEDLLNKYQNLYISMANGRFTES